MTLNIILSVGFTKAPSSTMDGFTQMPRIPFPYKLVTGLLIAYRRGFLSRTYMCALCPICGTIPSFHLGLQVRTVCTNNGGNNSMAEVGLIKLLSLPSIQCTLLYLS